MRFILLTLTISFLTIFTSFQTVQPTAAAAAAGKNPFVTADDDFQRISLEDAKKDYDAGTATIIDARDADAYKAEHIKGAINIPYGDFKKKYKSVPKNKKIIAYCSCPTEATSGLIVEKFNEKKIKNAYALAGGIKVWKAAGYPMEQ